VLPLKLILSEDCVAESLTSDDPGTQKRRSTRIVQAVPITVTGVDALGQPFKERTTTVMINCHGCKYQSKHYVPKNSMVTLEIPRPEADAGHRTVVGRVIWVQRPRAVRELFQIGLEFDVAGNIWGIAFPPEDWFPLPGEEAAAAKPAPAPPATVAVPEAKAPTAEQTAVPATPVPVEKAETPAVAPATPAAPTAPSDAGKIHLVPEPTPSPEAQLAAARQMAKVVSEVKETLDKSMRKEAQAAINDEMTIVRQQLDAQLHDAVEKAIKISMERVTESSARKVVQQAAERTAAIVEEARKAGEAASGQLDAKVRQAVEQAVTHVAESAAQQAAAQAATQNLKQTVEDTVERVLSDREATSPSLQILASPEAAQQNLDQWKKNLEETAQSVRDRTIGQSQADAAATKQRWNEEFENTVAAASQKLDTRLADVSRAALARATEELTARSTSLRASLDQTAAGAQSTVEHSRQHLEEIASASAAEIERRADQVIVERTQHLEPILRGAAQKIVDQFSSDLDQKLAPGVAGAQQALSDLAKAGQQAAQLENNIREQVRHASEEAAQIQTNVREQVRQASEQALAESLEQARQATAKLPAEFEESCRATLSKVEEELDQKSSEMQHTTYEALLKASDWYQKKAQTTMQSTLEKAVEQSTAALRDRAAEISSLVASELDHYRRTYVEYSHAQIEEAAKEVVERERDKLSEAAEITGASFSDRVQQVAGESLRRFEEASREALEKTRSDMEYDREGSLAEFQRKLDEGMVHGVEQARTHLQSQLGTLMEAWEAKRQAQQTEWVEQIKKSSDDSIEAYKSRLENASNSWLLASATNLGQNSQAIMDTLAKAAEKRLKETCAEVLAGMGDTLKERLLGLSAGFAAEDDDETPGQKK
jgi:hypothetical protein